MIDHKVHAASTYSILFILLLEANLKFEATFCLSFAFFRKADAI